MKIYPIALLSLALASTMPAAIAAPTTTVQKSAQSYNWATTPNYASLRKSIGWSDDYSTRCEYDRPLKQMTTAMNNEQWSQAVKLGNTWLNKCPIDIRMHQYVGLSYGQMGNKTEAGNHLRWMDGLITDLLDSGDGRTQQTAFEVISIGEEYDALYMLNLQPKQQALIQGANGVAYDLMTVTDKDGNEIELYFNPAAHFARLTKMFD